MPRSSQFLSGVIEGFYGPPWSAQERRALFEQMAALGLNTYVYAPKDDLKHRAIWREPYSEEESAALQLLISHCGRHGIEFVYALAPGLDVRYTADEDRRAAREKLGQMQRFGCRSFALLFDDIPDTLPQDDRAKFGSFARAQANWSNEAFQSVRGAGAGGVLLFCPTPYCGRSSGRCRGACWCPAEWRYSGCRRRFVRILREDR